MRLKSVLMTAVLAAQCGAAGAASCTVTASERRVPLLELYTSQGCDSCPPTDRWLSGLRARRAIADRVAILAFHVDYWDRLGWRDPYAQPRHSERQRHAAARNQARVVYTPQLMLNGRDYRRPAIRDDLEERLTAIHSQPPRARFNLTLTTGEEALRVHGNATVSGPDDRRHAQLYVALFENHLSNRVTAGENRGKQLSHDYVVRDLIGPLHPDAQGIATVDHRFRVDRTWKAADLGIVAFVQHQVSGETLHAVTAGRCG